MHTYRIRYSFSEEVEYDSDEEAQSESDDAASGIADTERLHIESVQVERLP